MTNTRDDIHFDDNTSIHQYEDRTRHLIAGGVTWLCFPTLRGILLSRVAYSDRVYDPNLPATAIQTCRQAAGRSSPTFGIGTSICLHCTAICTWRYTYSAGRFRLRFRKSAPIAPPLACRLGSYNSDDDLLLHFIVLWRIHVRSFTTHERLVVGAAASLSWTHTLTTGRSSVVNGRCWNVISSRHYCCKTSVVAQHGKENSPYSRIHNHGVTQILLSPPSCFRWLLPPY